MNVDIILLFFLEEEEVEEEAVEVGSVGMAAVVEVDVRKYFAPTLDIVTKTYIHYLYSPLIFFVL